MIHTKIETEFHQTEDKSKLINVILNFSEKFNEKIIITEKHQSKFISSEADGLDCLQNLFEGLRKQRIVQAARKIFNLLKDSDGVSFMLNKQALFVGKFHFSETPDESPMGPVWVRIKSDNIDSLLEYIAPETRKGIPIEVEYIPE